MSSKRHPQDDFWETLWGLALTLSLGGFIFLIFAIIQTIALVVYAYSLSNWSLQVEIENIISSLYFDGNAISFAEIPAVITGCLLIFLFTKLRTNNIFDYLQLKLAPLKTTFKWLVIMAIVITSLEASYILLERETPKFMTEVYKSTTYYPLLWLAVIIAAPLFEELLFRGYLLEGIRQTPIGDLGAMLITSASWALVHPQYGWFEISTIFIVGMIFSYAKFSTKSLAVPILMHMLMNITATVLMEIK